MKKIILFFFLFLTISVFPHLVFAQDDSQKTGFSISPPLIDMVINQADNEKSFVLNISNHSPSSEVFKLSVLDFGSLQESAGVAFFGFEKKELENKYSLASWIKLEKDAFVVDPDQTLPVKITIINRQSLSPGGHYGAILVKLDDQNSDQTRLVGLTQNYASLIFVKKTGGEVYGLDLAETNFKPNPIIMTKEINLRFENVGNVHLVPRGKVEIEDPRGKLVAKGIVNSDSAIIMPESFRNYFVKINKVDKIFWPGKYSLKVGFRHQGLEEFKYYQTGFFYFGDYLFWGLMVLLPILAIVLFVKTKRVKKK